ncbi:hypothetical protein D9M71_689060 [compost metagenome]
MSAGRISTATPRRLIAAWQARVAIRRACAGVHTCSQNTLQLAYTALKSTSCGNSMPSSVVTTWLAISTSGVRLRLASKMPLMKCSPPGPHEPAHAARRPLTSDSAPAANAAASSWRTCTHAISLLWMASVTWLRVSPTMP